MTAHGCCGWGDVRHAGTCHHCGSTEGPMHAEGSEQVGEPVCARCGRTIMGNLDP